MTVFTLETSPVQPSVDTLGQSPVQSQPEALDPMHLPITGNGRLEHGTIAYTNTVAGRLAVQQPNEFDRVVAGEFAGESTELPSYVASVDRAGAPKPQWHAFVETEAGASAPAAAEATPRPQNYTGRHEHAETSRSKRWLTGIGRRVANLAIRLTGGTDGTEAVTREGAMHPGYVSRHRRNVEVESQLKAMTAEREDVGLDIAPGVSELFEPATVQEAAATSAAFVGVASVAAANKAPIAFVGKANVADAMAALQPAAAPTVTEEAPAATPPVKPEVVEVKAPGTALELHPTANKKAVLFNGTAAEAFLQGLQEEGYSDLEAFKAAAADAKTPEMRAALKSVLKRIVSSKGGAWHEASNKGSGGQIDLSAQEKFTSLTRLTTDLAKEVGLRPRGGSVDEKERLMGAAQAVAPEVKLTGRPDLAAQASVIAASRLFRR